MFIYAICLVVGLLFTLVSAIAGHFFGGHDGGHVGTGGHAEAGFDDSGIPGISFFSPLVLASFLTAFGGFGIIFSDIKATESVWISAPLSIAAWQRWWVRWLLSSAQYPSRALVKSPTFRAERVTRRRPERRRASPLRGGARSKLRA
jgi:hypothetical protein